MAVHADEPPTPPSDVGSAATDVSSSQHGSDVSVTPEDNDAAAAAAKLEVRGLS
jgi:hypothetical protein